MNIANTQQVYFAVILIRLQQSLFRNEIIVVTEVDNLIWIIKILLIESHEKLLFLLFLNCCFDIAVIRSRFTIVIVKTIKVPSESCFEFFQACKSYHELL